MYSEKCIKKLNEISKEIRIKTLKMIHKRGAGHPGGSLSAIEVLTALYFSKMKIDPKNPEMEERDRFILSKGHASAALYTALSIRGFFPRKDLESWGAIDSYLQGHPDRNKTPGVDFSTGTLGHGLNVASGLLLAAKIRNKCFKTYVLLGDGEIQSGVIWEGAMTAAKYKLSNLVAILDYNGVQLDGTVDEIMPLEPIIDKWKSFNFEVIEINGNDIRQVLEALDLADHMHVKPKIIIARTKKGKGVSFMENKCEWHGTAPSCEQLEISIKEIEGLNFEN